MTSPPSAGPATDADLEHDRVEADRVRQVLARHEVGNERLARRQIERAGRGAARPRSRRPATRPSSPRNVSSARTAASAAMIVCVTSISLRRSSASAATPLTSENTTTGTTRDQPDEARARARAGRPATSSETCHRIAARLHQAAGERDQQAQPEQAEVTVLQRDEHGELDGTRKCLWYRDDENARPTGRDSRRNGRAWRRW